MGEIVASEMVDLLVIGAGPTGLACAIEAQRAGLTAILVDKGCLCNSLFHYPANMTFFTTPELLEIGNIPFSSPNQKPNRNEALEYYRKVAEHYDLDIRQYKNGEIKAYFNSNVVNIAEDDVTLATPDGPVKLPNHFVFALTGYHPDFSFIESLGVTLDEANDRCPVCDPATHESNVPGIYLAGVVVAGERTNEIFIENGRFHGELIAKDLQEKLVAV